jgi:hypothetical protein
MRGQPLLVAMIGRIGFEYPRGSVIYAPLHDIGFLGRTDIRLANRRTGPARFQYNGDRRAATLASELSDS